MKSSWADGVISNTASNNISKMRLVYRQRWRLLEAFAKFTTNRLKQVRGLLNDPKLIKAKVTNDQLSQLLNTRVSLIDEFISELRDMFKGYFTEVLEFLYITKSGRRDDISNDEFLRLTVANVYKGIWSEKVKAEIKEITNVTTDEKNFTTSFNAVKGLFTKTFVANKHQRRLEKCENPAAKQLLYKHIGLIALNIVDLLKQISITPEHDLEIIFVLLNFKTEQVKDLYLTVKLFDAEKVGKLDPAFLNSKAMVKVDTFKNYVSLFDSLLPFFNGIMGIFYKLD
jgi:hypothetical protein